LFAGDPRGANRMAQHSTGVLDAIYMPDCESDSLTPIAGENTASAIMQVAMRRMAGGFATNDHSATELSGTAVSWGYITCGAGLASGRSWGLGVSEAIPIGRLFMPDGYRWLGGCV